MTQPDEHMTLPENGVIVCITNAAAGRLLALTLDSVKAHTAAEVPVVVLGPGTPGDPRQTALLPTDVVLLEPGCVVAAGWLDGLRDAVASGGVVATVSALTQLDVNVQPRPDFDDDAAAARSRSRR